MKALLIGVLTFSSFLVLANQEYDGTIVCKSKSGNVVIELGDRNKLPMYINYIDNDPNPNLHFAQKSSIDEGGADYIIKKFNADYWGMNVSIDFPTSKEMDLGKSGNGKIVFNGGASPTIKLKKCGIMY